MGANYCQHCGQPYTPERSHAELRYTFCGVICEVADMVPISQLLMAERSELTPTEKAKLVEYLRQQRQELT